MKVRVQCRIMRETEKSILIRQEEPNSDPINVWIPVLQCGHIAHLEDDGKKGISVQITITDRLANKHHLKCL